MNVFGQIIDIDLGSCTIRSKPYTAKMACEHLGGFGFNVATLFEQVDAGTDPLGVENIMVLSPGLLTGTAVPCSSRLHICARSPQSGLMGSSNVGGFFGARMYALNIRSIILRGRSNRPLWLHLSTQGPRLIIADHLWGMDTRKTASKLQQELNDENVQSLVIGPAGENQLPFACIMAGLDHSAGRNGLGAVMGAKMLKAITIETVKTTQAVSPQARSLIKQYIQSIQKTTPENYKEWSQYGSAGHILELNRMGLLGCRNYQQGQDENAAQIDGRYLQRYVKKSVSCHKCPVHCKAEIQINKGRHKGFSGGRPEYETAINMGSLCGLTDPEELLYLANLCNMLGMDTISTGSIIAFAMNLFQQHIITVKDTDGVILNWGDAKAMETLMHRMVKKEGFGSVLARGVQQAAQIIGRGAEKYAFHVKNVEIYGCDPRGLSGTALAYAVSLRGGDFTSVYPVPEFRYSSERAKKEFGSRKAVEFTATEGKGAMVRYCMIVSAVLDALGLCKVAALSIADHFDLQKEAELINAITGIEMSVKDLMKIGERTVNMEKCFNIRHGATGKMDNLPAKFTTEPVSEGPATGAKVNLVPMVEDFYKAMGWAENGVPTSKTLHHLGLSLKY